MPKLWYDSLWHPNMGFLPPTAEQHKQHEICLFDFDPFVFRSFDRFHPDGIRKQYLVKNAISLAIDYHWKTFVLLTEHPEELRAFMLERAKDWTAPSLKVNRLESITVQFPPPNLVIATRIFDQASAAQRIFQLWRAPAAARMVIYDPQGPINLDYLQLNNGFGLNAVNSHALNWLVVDAQCTRKLDVNWVQNALKQCNEVSLIGDGGGPYREDRHPRVPCFVVKLGANVYDGATRLNLSDRKGADEQEWAPGLRMRTRIGQPQLMAPERI